ncbi:hypothetical protein [Pseudomonas anguilliseptica]|uniref:hypothetical protein n=1 Tax=Pseudomonas anguilliseptica TaxID=53406 RepID=UPI001F467CEF|nr:hypothetical protein [Pseudomonas anguilliseptica]MCE5364371.1 hypothetical protein [Pseudomonas anguilliseptica]
MHLRDVIQPAATASHVVGLCALAYFASAQLVGLLAWWGGMSQGDAVMLAIMLGFIYLLLLLLLGFSRERRRNAWLLLGGLSLLAWGTPLLLQVQA